MESGSTLCFLLCVVRIRHGCSNEPLFFSDHDTRRQGFLVCAPIRGLSGQEALLEGAFWEDLTSEITQQHFHLEMQASLCRT